MSTPAILFDIGGTNTRVGVTRDGRRFRSTVFATPRSPREGMAKLKASAASLGATGRFAAVVGGIAGPLDRNHRRLLRAPNLFRGWVDFPLKRSLERTFRANVTVENDSAVVALGEATYGAGRGKKIVAYLGVGTGVGGARVVDGSIDAHAFGFEPGHQIIDPRGPVCRCGGRGHLEALVGGSYVERRIGRDPATVKTPAFWKRLSHWLAIGVHNLVLTWSPDVVVIGGSMLKTPGIPVAELRRNVRRLLTIYPTSPPIVRGRLGDLGGLYGSLALLKRAR